MLDAMAAYWEREGDRARLHMERFQPIMGCPDAPHGEGGVIDLSATGVEAASDGTTPILVAGERAGATLPYGCRMGICHTCVGRLCSGQVRDSAHRQGVGAARRDGAHVHQRPGR